MGYTHYWYRKEETGNRQLFQQLGTDARRIIAEAETRGVRVGNWGGFDEPDFTELRFALNGLEEQSHETFVWESDVQMKAWQKQAGLEGDEVFYCCKTAYKPYDAVVTAILIRAKELYGDKVRISSDGWWGDWAEGRSLYQAVFGNEAPCPFDSVGSSL